MHLSEHVTTERSIKVDADRGRQAVVDRLLIGEAIVVEAEQRVGTGIDGHVDAGVGEQPPVLVRHTGAVIEDIMRPEHALLGEFRSKLGEIADELG